MLYSIRISLIHVPNSAFLSGCVYVGSSEAPEIRNMVKELNVLMNQEVFLTCEVHGFPKPSLTWLKEGVPIATGL